MEHLKQNSVCVYIEVPYRLLAMRLGNLKKRGVVLPEGFTLEDLYNKRVPLYQSFADITVPFNKPGSLDVAARKLQEDILAYSTKKQQ